MTDLDDIAQAYHAWLELYFGGQTVTSRAKFARSRLAAWGHPSTWDLSTMQRYITWDDSGAEPRRRAAWTASTYRNHLHNFGGWCGVAGLLPPGSDPFAGLRTVQRPSKTPRPLSEPQVAAVLADADDDQRAWLLLALHAGLRAHEIAKFRGEDIGEDYVYVEGKGGKRALIPTHRDLWELAQSRPHKGYWFPGGESGHLSTEKVSASVGRLFRRHGLSGSVHRLRHTFGTRLVSSGVDLRRVQTLMRHSSLATTEGYLAVSDEGLRDAIHLLPGA